MSYHIPFTRVHTARSPPARDLFHARIQQQEARRVSRSCLLYRVVSALYANLVPHFLQNAESSVFTAEHWGQRTTLLYSSILARSSRDLGVHLVDFGDAFLRQGRHVLTGFASVIHQTAQALQSGGNVLLRLGGFHFQLGHLDEIGGLLADALRRVFAFAQNIFKRGHDLTCLSNSHGWLFVLPVLYSNTAKISTEGQVKDLLRICEQTLNRGISTARRPGIP